MSGAVDLRRGFRRTGSALFWLLAALVAALMFAERMQLLSLGWWLLPIAIVLLLAGVVASVAARLAGLALETAARSELATKGATTVSSRVAGMSWPVRLALNFVPGANLLTLADLIAAAGNGTLANSVRSQFNWFGLLIGGGLMLAGAAWAATRLGQGRHLLAGPGTLAAIGFGVLLLFRIAAGWIAAGFSQPDTGAR